MRKPHRPDRIEAMPLWRLLVLLEDVEREHGSSCPTARAVARIVSDRLKAGRTDTDLTASRQEVRGG